MRSVTRVENLVLQDTLGNLFYARTRQKEVALVDALPVGAQSIQEYIITRLAKPRA